MSRWSGALALALGCVGGGGEAGRLEGIWVATDADEGLHRALEIARLDEPVGGLRQRYTLWMYPVGEPPEAVQSGLFSVVDDEVLWDVRWDVEPLHIGVRFASALERPSRRELALDGRVYTRADAIPPGDTQVAVWGEAAWAVPLPGGLGTLLRPQDDGVLAGTSAVANDRATWVRSDGRELRSVRLERATQGQFAPLVAAPDGWGFSDGTTTRRYRRVFEPGDAFVPDGWGAELVWSQPLHCFHLINSGEDWTGHCARGGQQVLTRFDVATGTPRWEIPAPTLVRAMWSLGDDVLWLLQGVSEDPVHGARGQAGGWRIERRGPEAELVWAHWVPAAVRIDAVTDRPDGGALLTLTGFEGALAGATLSGAEPRAKLLALDGQGSVAWERPLPLSDGFGVLVQSTDAGFAMVVGAEGYDAGESVGLLGAPGEPELAVIAHDACGRAWDAVSWPECSGTCSAFASSNPTVIPTGLARAAGGDLFVQAEVVGVLDIGREPVGFPGERVGLLARVPDPPVAPPCEVEPELPQLQLTVSGPGQVAIPGLGVCGGQCAWSVERFAALELVASPEADAALSQVSGACAALPCLVHADTPEVRVEVVFAPSGG